MNRLLSILLLFCVYSHLYAQTPYDAFAPEMSRPILDVVQDMDTYIESLQPPQLDIPLVTQDDISKWLSPDPLSDKYPEISPYAYCGWNPIKYIDPDGRKCTLSVNYKTNTITISAKYYALKGDSRYAQKAANFWNNQKGLTYTAKDGTNYSVQFALNVYSSKNPEKDAGTDDNTFKLVSMLGTNIEGYKKTGVTEANYKISVVDAYKEETTAAHEVGHTLMNVQGGKESEHTPTGVMTKSISDKGRSASVSQETVNSIVESNGFKQNPTLWQRIRSWFE